MSADPARRPEVGPAAWRSDAPAISPSDLVRRAAAADPDGVALIDGSTRWSWARLEAEVSRAALALQHRGLARGDRLALHLGTGIDFVQLYLGANRAGLVVVPVNPAYTLPELAFVLSDSGARVLITGSIVMIQAAEQLPVAEVIVAARSAPDGFLTVAQLLAGAPGQPDLPDQPGPAVLTDVTGEQIGLLLYTSGTSGRPKGAMLSVRALMTNLAQLGDIAPALLTADDVAYIPLPLFHVFGLNAGLGLALSTRATVVLTDHFDAATSLETMAATGVTAVIGAPTMFALWAAQPDLGRGFANVRLALAGSAPLAPALVSAYARAGIALHEGFGLTEAAPVVCVNLLSPRPKPGSVGRAIPGVEIELRDADGGIAEEQDPGEMFIRGANLFSGYWPDGADGPDGPDGPGGGGWFGTGDIALRDEDGDLYLVGRTNDLILVNGFNVYPAEVEAVLGAIEGVAEVAVLGEPDPVTGEAVKAYVVLQPGATLDAAALVAAASTSLARFKLPRDVQLVAGLPHTSTGKVMKWQLRAPVAERGAHRASE
jgi:long-chain acyl-CoA synthetase